MNAIQRLMLNKAQKEALNREIKQQVMIYNERYETDYDTLILYTLYTEFGFGKKRLQRFFFKMNEARKTLKDFYGADNVKDETIDLFVMKKRLQEAGIAPEALLQEIYGEIEKQEDLEK